jgi:hypothetical protein
VRSEAEEGKSWRDTTFVSLFHFPPLLRPHLGLLGSRQSKENGPDDSSPFRLEFASLPFRPSFRTFPRSYSSNNNQEWTSGSAQS